MKKNTIAEQKAESFGDILEDLVREKVQSFIQDILEEELDQWLGRDRYERNDGPEVKKGRRNGHGKPRKLGLSCGTIEIQRPRVRDTDEEFRSLVLPLFVRSSHKLREQLPDLYLHGLSMGDFELALRGLLGKSAPLSKSSIDRLRGKWKTEYDSWCERDLSGLQIVYMWADGVYVKAGLEKEKAALLVVIGADVHGKKHLLAVNAGYRESTESWLAVFRGLKKRGSTTRN
jgi:putative transposase